MVRHIIRLIQRTFRIGKEQYFVGQDLAGNSYYEKQVMGSEYTRPKRFVNFKNHRNDPTLYRTHHLSPQWSAWLSFTRHHPPSIEELQADQLRLVRLQDNVRRLAIEDQARRQAEPTKHAVLESNDSSSSPDLRESIDPTDDRTELERKRQKLSQSPLSAFTLQPQTNPDEAWQPEPWNPQPASRSLPPREDSKMIDLRSSV